MEEASGELLSALMLTPCAFARAGSMAKTPRHKDTTEKPQAQRLKSVRFNILIKDFVLHDSEFQRIISKKQSDMLNTLLSVT
jgi:hypothetical protein